MAERPRCKPDENHFSNAYQKDFAMSATTQKLSGKVALVTGGARGIGAAIAKRLAAEGATVAITYTKSADAAKAIVDAIEQDGGKGLAIRADAADAAAARNAVEQTVRELGKLDILVNNAGTAIPKPFEDATLEELDTILNLNVRGVFITTQAALKHLGTGGASSTSALRSANALPPRVWLLMLPPREPSKCSRRDWRANLAPEALRSITCNRDLPTRT